MAALRGRRGMLRHARLSTHCTLARGLQRHDAPPPIPRRRREQTHPCDAAALAKRVCRTRDHEKESGWPRCRERAMPVKATGLAVQGAGPASPGRDDRVLPLADAAVSVITTNPSHVVCSDRMISLGWSLVHSSSFACTLGETPVIILLIKRSNLLVTLAAFSFDGQHKRNSTVEEVSYIYLITQKSFHKARRTGLKQQGKNSETSKYDGLSQANQQTPYRHK
ncbi:hypothetical protein B296_00029773 [Ensete ventricosum]|uniref:Uncharacterized protein n=1 Tax=Ensete ventricosum TaxID=4639 RepID=A0A427A1J8_ENSVE|nr:hypothetical protein B296_00029773 [Ensete ventricosum]